MNLTRINLSFNGISRNLQNEVKSIANPQNIKIAFLALAAICVFALAFFIGRRICFKGTKQPDNIFETWKKKAEQGDSKAQNILGDYYRRGDGVPQDHAKAVEWYKKAADQGNWKAQLALGHCYNKGEGILQDRVKGAEWIDKCFASRDEAVRKAIDNELLNGA